VKVHEKAIDAGGKDWMGVGRETKYMRI